MLTLTVRPQSMPLPASFAPASPLQPYSYLYTVDSSVRIPKLKVRNRAVDDAQPVAEDAASRTPDSSASTRSSANGVPHNAPAPHDVHHFHPQPRLQEKKKSRTSFMSFLSAKEPSLAAFEQFAEQQRRQAAEKGQSLATTGATNQKLPAHVPKVNSRWDGLPNTAHHGQDRSLASWKSSMDTSVSRRGRNSKFSGHSSNSSLSTGSPSSPFHSRITKDKVTRPDTATSSSSLRRSKSDPRSRSSSKPRALTRESPAAPKSPKHSRSRTVSSDQAELSQLPLASPSTETNTQRRKSPPNMGITVPPLGPLVPKIRDDRPLSFNGHELPDFPDYFSVPKDDRTSSSSQPYGPDDVFPESPHSPHSRLNSPAPQKPQAAASMWPLPSPVDNANTNSEASESLPPPVPMRSDKRPKTPSPTPSPRIVEFPRPILKSPTQPSTSKDRAPMPRNFARPFAPPAKSTSSSSGRVAVPASAGQAKARSSNSSGSSRSRSTGSSPSSFKFNKPSGGRRQSPAAMPGRVITKDTALATIPESDAASVASLRLSLNQEQIRSQLESAGIPASGDLSTMPLNATQPQTNVLALREKPPAASENSPLDETRPSTDSLTSLQKSPRERLGLGGFIKHDTGASPWPLPQEEDEAYILDDVEGGLPSPTSPSGSVKGKGILKRTKR